MHKFSDDHLNSLEIIKRYPEDIALMAGKINGQEATFLVAVNSRDGDNGYGVFPLFVSIPEGAKLEDPDGNIAAVLNPN